MFPEVRIHHRESYVSIEEAPMSQVSFNHFPLQARSHLSLASTLDFFPYGGEIEAFTNFSRHTTTLGACRRRLGAQSSKSNKRDDELFSDELECSRMDFSSLALNLPISQPNSFFFSNLTIKWKSHNKMEWKGFLLALKIFYFVPL